MNKTDVRIHILPSNLNIKESTTSWLQNASMSTLDEIYVNKAPDGFAVMYTDETFKQLDIRKFVENLVCTFKANLPGISINISAHYRFWTPDTFCPDCAITIIQFDDYMEEYPEGNNVTYTCSQSVEFIYNAFDDEDGSFNLNPNEEDEEDGTVSIDPDDIKLDPEVLATLGQYLDLDLDGEGDDDEEECGKKHKKKSYGSSRILKGATKNPKKQFKRHGIIIASDKSAIKKDEKIIKAFLKDFIPGDSSWIKEFREEVLERWMRMYAISKKRLKKLEKEHRKSKGGKSKSRVSKESAMTFTRNLFSRDEWANPNK